MGQNLTFQYPVLLFSFYTLSSKSFYSIEVGGYRHDRLEAQTVHKPWPPGAVMTLDY